MCAAAKYRRSINITQHFYLFPINALILIHRSGLCREVGGKDRPVRGSIKTQSFVPLMWEKLECPCVVSVYPFAVVRCQVMWVECNDCTTVMDDGLFLRPAALISFLPRGL